MFGRDEAREDAHAAGLDDEVVVAAAVLLPAILDDAQAPPVRAVVRRQLLQADHAVGHAVHGAVVHLRREVVQHHHGGAVLGEVVLQSQDLTPVAERALRQQHDLREAVDDHAIGLHALERLEDALGRLPQLKVGGVEQALLLLLVEQVLGRDQFKDFDSGQIPGVRRRAGPVLGLGLRQGDVERALAAGGACDQPLGRHRRLASARVALQHEQPPPREAPGGDVVQPRNAEVGLFVHDGSTFRLAGRRLVSHGADAAQVCDVASSSYASYTPKRTITLAWRLQRRALVTLLNLEDGSAAATIWRGM